MKKVLLVVILLLLLHISSCSSSRYTLNKFFDNDYLTERQVSDLPVMPKDYLHKKASGFVGEVVYAQGTKVEYNTYVEEVYKYLLSSNYYYLGTIGKLRQHIGLVPVDDSYYYREVYELVDFYHENKEAYYFVYASQNNISMNEYEEQFIVDVQVMVIEWCDYHINDYDDNGSFFEASYALRFFSYPAIVICDDIVVEDFKYMFTQQYYVTEKEYLGNNTEEINEIFNMELKKAGTELVVDITEYLKLKTYLTNNYLEVIKFKTFKQAKDYYKFYLSTRSKDSDWRVALDKNVVILTDDDWVRTRMTLDKYANLEFE